MGASVFEQIINMRKVTQCNEIELNKLGYFAFLGLIRKTSVSNSEA